MGNYLTKVSDTITSVIKQDDPSNKKRAKKRKHIGYTNNPNKTTQTNGEIDSDIESNDDDDDDDDEDTINNNDLGDDNDSNDEDIIADDEIVNRIIANTSTSNNRILESAYEEIRNATTSNTDPTSTATTTTTQPTTKKILKSKKNLKIEKRLQTPTKKKMKSTSTYIYNTLYLKGENSDIIVKALNKEWKLHKIYLCQSPYFSSMLQGNRWKESTQAVIDISIPDLNISEQALFIAFGSLYKDDIEIIPNDVVSVLAAASLFSLDGLLNECAQIMLENINLKTVCYYYEAALTYGIQVVLEKTLQWLCLNIMINNDIKYTDISTHLFHKIISSNDLMIIQVETDLYTLCKKWLYYQLNNTKPSDQQKSWQKNANEFFTKYIKENSLSYLLESPALQQYVCIFKQIRFQHIITDLSSLKIIFNDRIVPQSWIEPHYCTNWLNALYIDQHTESTEYEINEIDFKRECVRFGRVLNEDNIYTWRWVGFHFGIDLLVTYMNHSFTLKRNITYIHSPYKGLLSNKPIQRIYYIMSVAQLDKYGNVKWFKRTEFNCLDLHKNEEKFVFNLDSTIQFPLIMNLHVACHPQPTITSNLILES